MTVLRNWYKGVYQPAVTHSGPERMEIFEWFFFVNPQGDDPNKAINPMVTGAFGAVAGAASVFGNTPLDVIKTRMQVGGVSRSPRLRFCRVCGGVPHLRASSPTGSGGPQVQEHAGLCDEDHEARGSDGVRSHTGLRRVMSLDHRHLISLSFRLIQVLQRHRPSAGTSVFGRGHRLHHLRGGGQGLKRRLEDGLNTRTQRCSRRTGWTWQDSGRSPITPASRF